MPLEMYKVKAKHLKPWISSALKESIKIINTKITESINIIVYTDISLLYRQKIFFISITVPQQNILYSG